MNLRKLQVLSQRYQVVLLDLDRTLVDFDSVEYLANVATYIDELHRLNVKTAIVTNQGGPACKHNGFKGNYPEVNDVLQRVWWVAGGLGIEQVYICWAYLSKDLVFYYPAMGTPPYMPKDDWKNEQATWRKPEPGMLRQAARDFKVMPQFILMVGDSKSDHDAAKAFGCDSQWAHEFFDWPQPEENPSPRIEMPF